MRVRTRSRRTLTTATSVVIALGVIAGCGGGGSEGASGPGGGGGGNGVLNVGMPNGPQTNNNNPFLDTSAGASLGYRAMIYEPLAMTNPVRPDQDPDPWLAESWEFSEDFTQITITAREGVTWADGEDFTAEDIAFTFDMLMNTDALNTAGLPYSDVAVDGNTVTVTFESSQFVNQTRILDTYIVPEHIWSEVEAPEMYEDQEPVGTGPYSIDTFTPQTVTLVRRDSYWQDLPEVEELRYTSYNDNNAQTTALANGDSEWSYVFMPDYESVFVERDPENHKLWFPTGLGIHGLWINNERAPFDDPALRRAMSMVIDRESISSVAHAGLYPLLENPTGLPLPAGESFIAPEFQGQVAEPDVDGARAVLEEAGYELDGDTLRTPEGDPVTLTLTDPAGWSDYLTALSIIRDNFAEIGIEASVETQTVDAWTDAVNAGGFDATLHWTNTGATPYDMYANIMDGDLYKPIGEASPGGNFGRFQNDEATAALAEYREATDDNARNEALYELQRILVDEVPMIPTVAGPIGAEYSTKNWTGWPTEEDPYAPPQPTQRGALEVVLNLEAAN
ncbi:ABC transporter substrate-binding protein [Streptomyces sp. NPDC049879]|uniref:ABC transporter substrate-binding protein n=1 Tax=Streptomyces sp. NPDC049879 TaxID=3365598 RepID=UPI003789761C